MSEQQLIDEMEELKQKIRRYQSLEKDPAQPTHEEIERRLEVIADLELIFDRWRKGP
jgi:ribosome-binding protein aMBF1 (putative translation factor)